MSTNAIAGGRNNFEKRQAVFPSPPPRSRKGRMKSSAQRDAKAEAKIASASAPSSRVKHHRRSIYQLRISPWTTSYSKVYWKQHSRILLQKLPILASFFWAKTSPPAPPPAPIPAPIPHPERMPPPSSASTPLLTPQFCFNQTALRGTCFLVSPFLSSSLLPRIIEVSS